MLKARFRKTLGGFTLDAELNLEQGINVLRGESGAGKTTVANLLSGAMKPDDGEIELEGLTVYSASAAFLCRRNRAASALFFSRIVFSRISRYGKTFFSRASSAAGSLRSILTKRSIFSVSSRFLNDSLRGSRAEKRSAWRSGGPSWGPSGF